MLQLQLVLAVMLIAGVCLSVARDGLLAWQGLGHLPAAISMHQHNIQTAIFWHSFVFRVEAPGTEKGLSSYRVLLACMQSTSSGSQCDEQES